MLVYLGQQRIARSRSYSRTSYKYFRLSVKSALAKVWHIEFQAIPIANKVMRTLGINVFPIRVILSFFQKSTSKMPTLDKKQTSYGPPPFKTLSG